MTIAPPVDVNGTEYRARLLDLAAYPRSVLLETVASAERAADAIVCALDIIFGGYRVGRPPEVEGPTERETRIAIHP